MVVGNAISRGNPELEEVLDRKIRYCSLPEAIRDHFLWGARSIVIAGTHGKTTTTSLTGWVLAHGGADPSVFIGGIAENFESSYRIGGGREFVIEGDEYDSAFFDKTAKFLKYLPDIAVVNNIEFDHADIYPDLASIRLAFQRFVNLVPRRGLLLLGADSAEALALEDARALPGRDVRVVRRRRLAGARSENEPRRRRRSRCGIGATRSAASSCRCSERYNVRNALAAIAVGAAIGLNTDTMREALRRFRGVRRRMELRGTADGVAVYDDFAHHPTAIGETLEGIRSAFPGRRVWAIFEPRSATSCRRIFQQDFVKALARADHVILPAVFRSSLPEDQRLNRRAGRRRSAAAGRGRALPSDRGRHRSNRRAREHVRRHRGRHVEWRLRRYPWKVADRAADAGRPVACRCTRSKSFRQGTPRF